MVVDYNSGSVIFQYDYQYDTFTVPVLVTSSEPGPMLGVMEISVENEVPDDTYGGIRQAQDLDDAVRMDKPRSCVK